MNIEDVKKIFPDIPIHETLHGFQMLDRPCIPDGVVRRLDNKVKHVGCYVFEWVTEET